MVLGATEFLVKIKPNSITALNSDLIKQKIRDDLFVVDQKDIQSLRTSEGIEYIEPNHKIYPYSQPDDLVRQQWWLKNKEGLDLSPLGAWAITTGSRDVVVAVLDTGVDFRHPDLKDNIWVNEAEILGVNGVDDDGNGYIDDFRGWSFYPDDNDTFDYRGHGTHVTGIIGAQGNNGVGVA